MTWLQKSHKGDLGVTVTGEIYGLPGIWYDLPYRSAHGLRVHQLTKLKGGEALQLTSLALARLLHGTKLVLGNGGTKDFLQQRK